jgi:anti-sigma-K factor RskA
MSDRDRDLRELIGPYVLGACSPAEAADVRARMVVDPAFRREVASYDAVRDALLEAPAPPADADPAAKARVMAVVRQEAALFAAASPEASTDERAPGRRRRRMAAALAPLRRPRPLAALATALVVIVVAGVAIGTGGDRSDDRDVTVVAGQVLGDAAPRGRAEVVVDGDAGELRLSGFPAAGEGRQYQVWVRTGEDDPRPTTVLFEVDGAGNATARIPPEAMVDTDSVLLTSEPDGGSPAPTRDPVLLVQMPA